LRVAPCPVAVAPHGYSERDPGTPAAVGVAFDGSYEAWAALHVGATFAATAGAGLTVIAVELPWFERPVHVNGGTNGAPSTAALLDEAVAGLPGVPHRLFLSGDPARELARACARDVDLLVMGSRGRGGIGRVLLGSVSTHLIRIADCPVVVVPRGARALSRAELIEETVSEHAS